MTIGLKPGVKKALDLAGIETVWIDRDRKPDYIKKENGGLEEWGTFEEFRNHKNPEDVRAVGDPGGVGCEPLVRIMAEDVLSLTAMLCRIVDSMGALANGL